MARQLIPLLQELDKKITGLTVEHQRLLAKIDSLEKENGDLRRELEDTRGKLRESENDARFLTMSHKLADSPDAIISTRRQIARLIRTVDKCISMLKEE